MAANNKTRRLLATVAFVLLMALLLGAAGELLRPREMTVERFYAEPKNSIDVLFVGGSHSMAAFSPNHLWAQYGFTSYVFYSWSQPMWVSYHYIKEALKTQSPQVVVLDAFMLCYGNTYIPTANIDETVDDSALLIRPSLNRLALAMAMSRSQQNARPFYRYVPLLRYHGRWKSLQGQELLYPWQDAFSSNKGFAPLYSTEAFAEPVVPAATPATEIWPAALAYFYKIVELSRSEGFELVVAGLPYVVESDAEWDIYRQLEELCAANGVAYVDYLSGGVAGFSYAEDMAEHAHVNYHGAEKISGHMGAFLKARYPLADRRADAAYAYWSEGATAEFYAFATQLLRTQNPYADGYLAHLAANGRYTAFVVAGGALGGDNARLHDGFAALGLSAGVLNGSAGGLVAVVEQGRVALQEAADAPTAGYVLAGHEVTLAGGAAAGIWIDGQAVALPYTDAVLVVVCNADSGEVLHSVAFLPQEGCITRTD